MPVLVEELTKLEGHRWQISCLSFSPDGARLATGSWDKETHIWNLGSLETEVTLSGLHETPITSLAWFKPEGLLLATGSADTKIGLWNSITGENLMVLKECFGWVLGTCFSTDGTFLAAASWDKIVRLWEPNTGSLLNTLHGHKGGVWSLDFHSERNVLCSGSADGTVRLWDARSNKCAAVYGEGSQAGSVYGVKWSPDNATIAAGSSDTKITIWDVRKQETVNVLSGHTSTVKSVTFNTNTHNVAIPILASAGDYSLKVWDPRPSYSGQAIASLSLHQHGKEVEAVSISPDGSLIATGGRDGVVILMTLFVPTIIPRTDSEVKREQHRKTFRTSYRLARQESFKKIGEAEPEITDFALDQMITEPKLPESSQLKRIHSRLKRRTRTSEKDFEIEQQETTAKEKVNMRKARKNRARAKSIDLPDMIVHLAAKATAYKPEVFSDSDSGEEQVEDRTVKQTEATPKGKVAAALKSFQNQSEDKQKSSSRERSFMPRDISMEFDNESLLHESGSYRVHDLDSSFSSIKSPMSAKSRAFSDSDSMSDAFSPPPGHKTSSTPLFAYGKDRSKLQDEVLYEEPELSEVVPNQTGNNSEGDEDIPYSMI